MGGALMVYGLQETLIIAAVVANKDYSHRHLRNRITSLHAVNMDGENSNLTRDECVKRKQSTLYCYFPTNLSKSKIKKQEHVDSMAEALSQRLNSEVHNLSDNGESWYVLKKSWLLPASEEEFKKEWDLHPGTRHALKVYGRACQENRWSQAWGVHYPYSGSVALAKPIDESHMLPMLLQKINKIMNELEFTGKGYS